MTGNKLNNIEVGTTGNQKIGRQVVRFQLAGIVTQLHPLLPVFPISRSRVLLSLLATHLSTFARPSFHPN